MRGAIKALIMANEYLEHELEELQALVSGRLDAYRSAPRKGRSLNFRTVIPGRASRSATSRLGCANPESNNLLVFRVPLAQRQN